MDESKTVMNFKDPLTRELLKGKSLNGKISREVIGEEMKCDANSRRKVILSWIEKNPAEAKAQRKLIFREERILATIKNPESYHAFSGELKELVHHLHNEKSIKEKAYA
jgi:hypothetical protein